MVRSSCPRCASSQLELNDARSDPRGASRTMTCPSWVERSSNRKLLELIRWPPPADETLDPEIHTEEEGKNADPAQQQALYEFSKPSLMASGQVLGYLIEIST